MFLFVVLLYFWEWFVVYEVDKDKGGFKVVVLIGMWWLI